MAKAHKGVRTQTTLRIPVDVHRQAVIEAARRRLSLNEWIVMAMENEMTRDFQPVGARSHLRVVNDDGQVIGLVQ